MDLADFIDRQAKQAPQKRAIRFGSDDLSYGALAQQIDRCAAALAASHLRRGDCVAYLGLNSAQQLILLFACARRGLLFMPLNWRLAPPEHAAMLEECPPKLLVVDAPFLEQTAPLAPPGSPMRVALGAAPERWLAWPQWVGSAATSAPRDPNVTLGAPLLLCYTSGSTSKPKGVVLAQDALRWNAANSVDMHAMTAEDRVLTTLPLFHVGGLNNQTTPALMHGASVVLHAKFDVDATFEAIERERITLAVLVPAQLTAMIEHPRWSSADLSSLRMITTGSTIVPERLIRAVHARGVPLAQVYGATETCPIAAYQHADEALRKVGSAGRAARHCELRIVDPTGAEVAGGACGEILVRGPNLMTGYWRQPQATAGVMADGWFHTGDLGHRDDEGFLYVEGRLKDLIISGGENISPAEIENVLLDCTDIAEASVVGRPDVRWGEVPVAVIVPKPGRTLSRAEVMALFDGRIARYKHPKDVVIVAELPRSALGKVRKDDVRRLVTAPLST
jgi:fatty-acyl-CoA synthase